MPAQPKLTLVGRQHRVFAFLSVAGLVGAAVLTVVPVSTTNRGREISCGSMLSPLNQENVSEAISCDLALNPRRFLTLVAFGLAIVLLMCS